MSLRVVGAGIGRTGTLSLKLALERLLEGRCYHMMETFGRPQDVGVWQHAANGDFPDWAEFLADYRAAVDWPASAFWPELAEAFPDALILLSTRPAEAWYKSAHDTIFAANHHERRTGCRASNVRAGVWECRRRTERYR